MLAIAPMGLEMPLGFWGPFLRVRLGQAWLLFLGGQFFNVVGLWLKGVFAICLPFPSHSKGFQRCMCVGVSGFEWDGFVH